MLKKPQSTRQRILSLFHSDTRGPKLVLGELGVVLGVGLLWVGITSRTLPTSLYLMFKIMPMPYWGILFISYGIFRLVSAYAEWTIDTARYTRYIGPLFGAWLWGCMLIAGIMMVDFNVTTLLYTIPMQLEIWIILQAVLWWTKYDAEDAQVVSGFGSASSCSCADDLHQKQP
jgi:hypothetical protein